jgi:palmitoyl-protein thioesterase
MAIVKHLKLLVIESLFAAAIAKPVERRFESGGDDDDTPLPLVIWHGKRAFRRPTEKADRC